MRHSRIPTALVIGSVLTIVVAAAPAAVAGTATGSVATRAASPRANRLESALRAAAGGRLSLIRDVRGTVRSVGAPAGRRLARRAAGQSPTAAAGAFLRTYGAVLGVADPVRDLRARVSTGFLPGLRATRFQQLVGGLPVVAGEVVVSSDAAGDVQSAAASTTTSSALVGGTGTVPPARAGQVALALVARHRHVAVSRLAAGGPQKWAYDPILFGAPDMAGARAVWRITVTGPGVKDLVLVDATTGRLIFDADLFEHAARNPDRVVCDFANGHVIDITRPGTPPGYNCLTRRAKRIEGGKASTIVDVNEAYDNTGETVAGYSALVGINLTDLIGTPGERGGPKVLRSSTRVCLQSAPAPCPLKNAFWNGSQVVLGAGLARAEDVVAHELSHGVTQHTSGLFPVFQSGAIAESMSDVFGELIDQRDGTGAPDSPSQWLIGERIPGGAIRSMSAPPHFGQPDDMRDTRWDTDPDFADNGAVHANSGVGNKAAYLIAHGATFNGVTVRGVGLGATAKLYWTVEHLLPSGANYPDLAASLRQACANLTASPSVTGITANTCAQVDRAARATFMDEQPSAVGKNPAIQAAACPTAAAPTPETAGLFADNFERAALGPNWSTDSPASWQLGGPGATYASSGRGSLIGRTPANVQDGISRVSHMSMTQDVQLPPIDPLTPAFLRFSHSYLFDNFNGRFFDGGQVEFSTDSGVHWVNAEPALPVVNGYNHAITPLVRDELRPFRGFGGSSNGFSSTRYDLSSLGGQLIRFRFRIAGGFNVGSLWAIDDVQVYSCAAAPSAPRFVTAQRAPSGSASVTLHWQQPVTGCAAPLTCIYRLTKRMVGTTRPIAVATTTATTTSVDLDPTRSWIVVVQADDGARGPKAGTTVWASRVTVG